MQLVSAVITTVVQVSLYSSVSVKAGNSNFFVKCQSLLALHPVIRIWYVNYQLFVSDDDNFISI